jgi:hypothetical protein
MSAIIARQISLVFGFACALAAQPTWSREVSRILQEKCQVCHRPDDIAPFSLLTYEDARAQARNIRHAVESREMPPWKPAPGHGEFKNNISLSDEQRQVILEWVDAGAPEGDPADMPVPQVFSDEWRLGAPDQVLSMPVAYTPVARNDYPDRYRCFVLPEVADRDRYVRAVDVAPGLRQQVHHVLLYLTDDPVQILLARTLEKEDVDEGYDCWGGPRIIPGAGPGLLKVAGGVLGGWAPGFRPVELPPDIGILIPKGAYVIMQVHYNLHEAGEVTAPDQTRVGLYFHENVPRNRLLALPLVNTQFVLEPGEMGKAVVAEFNLDFAEIGLPIPEIFMPKLSAIRIAPHMHQLGTQIGAELTHPDGTRVPLIQIDNWDFHWQGMYDYVAPVPLPYRSRLKATCVFDNTTDRTVRWGESTEDEMCLVYIGFIAEGGLSWLLFGNPL